MDPEELMEPAPKKGRGRSRGDSAVISRAEHQRIVDQLNARNDATKEAHEADLGRLDALSARLDELEVELETRSDSFHMDSLVEERLELLDRCNSLAGARLDFAGLSVRQLQLAAMEKAGHDVNRFDGKSDEYVAASFDCFVDLAGSRVDHVGALKRALGSASPKDSQGDPREAMEKQVASIHQSQSIAAA